MNIVIPLAGSGQRFIDAGITTPKPLIDIRGEPMIVAAVNSLGFFGNYIFIIRKFPGWVELEKLLYDTYPTCKVEVIDKVTEGPACTALLVKKYINNDCPLIIANCDQIMWWDGELFQKFCLLSDYDGIVVTFEGGEECKNSFTTINRFGQCKYFAEKQKISDIALLGIHYWKQGNFFVFSAETMIKHNNRAPNGEFYVSLSYNDMWVDSKLGVYHIPKEQYNSVGTPQDLNAYLERSKK